MSRVLLCVGVLLGVAALAQNRPIAPTDCDDSFAECKEDCAIKWGGTTNLKSRAKLNPCINKCGTVERDCRETFFETKRNNLDEGAISGSPSSRDVDSDGLPTKTAQKRPEEKKVEKKEDDLRDDRRREEPAPPVAERKKEPEPKPAYELKKEEVPKSNRSEVRVDKPVEKPAEKPKAAEPPAKREEPKKSSESDVRSEEPAPPPAKKVDKREEPKKKEEKRPALDEWDPDAL